MYTHTTLQIPRKMPRPYPVRISQGGRDSSRPHRSTAAKAAGRTAPQPSRRVSAVCMDTPTSPCEVHTYGIRMAHHLSG